MSGFSTSMTKSDYQTILSYYKMPYEDLSNRELKRQAETILATKLCKCIKAVEKKNRHAKRDFALHRQRVWQKGFEIL
jgi:hypothetical protein